MVKGGAISHGLVALADLHDNGVVKTNYSGIQEMNVTNVYVSYIERIIDEHRDDTEHSNWSETHEFDLCGVSLTPPQTGSFETFALAVNINSGYPVWVLCLRFSEGDSFGLATGKGEALWAFRDESKGHAAREAVEAQIKQKSSKLEFIGEDHSDICMSNPIDFYGIIESVSLEHFIVSS